MKRILLLVVLIPLVLISVSCGGRKTKKTEENGSTDSSTIVKQEDLQKNGDVISNEQNTSDPLGFESSRKIKDTTTIAELNEEQGDAAKNTSIASGQKKAEVEDKSDDNVKSSTKDKHNKKATEKKKEKIKAAKDKKQYGIATLSYKKKESALNAIAFFKSKGYKPVIHGKAQTGFRVVLKVFKNKPAAEKEISKIKIKYKGYKLNVLAVEKS